MYIYLKAATFQHRNLFIKSNSGVLCSVMLTKPCLCEPGMVGLAPKWVRLAPNETNPGLFQIRFQCIWRGGAKCTEI